MLTRRAATLLELLIALTVLGTVGAVVTAILRRQLRGFGAQAAMIDAQQQIRAAITVLTAELRELDATDGDISTIAAGAIEIRAMRWLGFTCRPALPDPPHAGHVTVTVARQPFFGLRDISANTDSILVLADPRSNRDPWIPGGIGGVNPLICPDGQPGTQLSASFASEDSRTVLDAMPSGTAVRGFERVRYRLYRPAGDTGWYLGAQTPGDVVQPLAGPFKPNGLELRYTDATGTPTADPTLVSRVDIIIRTGAESLVTSVALRNNRRP